MKNIIVTVTIVLGGFSTYSQSKFNPIIETGIAFRTGYIELSNLSKKPGQPYTTYTLPPKVTSTNVSCCHRLCL